MSAEKKSFIPPFFKNFGKSTKDLFKKKFDFENTSKIVNKTQNGITIETTSNVTQGFKGTVNTKYVNRDFGEVEVEVSTNASDANKANLKLKKLAQGLVATVGVASSGKDIKSSCGKPVTSADVEFSQEFFAAQAVIKTDCEKSKVDVYGSVGYDGLSVGGQVVYAGNAISETNVGVEYAQKDLTVSAYTEKNVEVVNVSFFQRLQKETAVGASIKYPLSSGDRTLTVGVEHQLDFDTVVKAKAELPTGVVSTAVEHKLFNPKMQFTVAAEFNAKSTPFVANKFGCGLTFGDF